MTEVPEGQLIEPFRRLALKSSFRGISISMDCALVSERRLAAEQATGAGAGDETKQGPARRPSGLRWLEWVQHPNVELRKVRDIASHHREVVIGSGRRDHCVLVQGVRSAVDQSGPGSKRRAVHGQHVVGPCDKIEPGLDLSGLGGV